LSSGAGEYISLYPSAERHPHFSATPHVLVNIPLFLCSAGSSHQEPKNTPSRAPGTAAKAGQGTLQTREEGGKYAIYTLAMRCFCLP
jgi:hypothetical protein